MRRLTPEEESDCEKTEALGEPYYPPPRTIVGRRLLPFLFSTRFALCLFAVGFLLLMLGGVQGVDGSRGLDDPAWAISGPGLALMAVAALLFA